MDPVSLTLGILPLAGGAIKIYKSIRSKLKVFCHYSSEIERLRKRFGRQRDYFLNEIELLIGLALDDHALVKDMIKDPDHSKWHCPALNKALRARMERNFDSLEGIIDDITATMEQFQDGFQCFEPLELERDSVSNLCTEFSATSSNAPQRHVHVLMGQPRTSYFGASRGKKRCGDSETG